MERTLLCHEQGATRRRDRRGDYRSAHRGTLTACGMPQISPAPTVRVTTGPTPTAEVVVHVVAPQVDDALRDELVDMLADELEAICAEDAPS